MSAPRAIGLILTQSSATRLVSVSVAHVNATAIMNRKRYTISHPPRVYEVAIATGLDSAQTRACLYAMAGISLKSASHKVPLPIAIRFLYWIKNQ